MNNNQDNRSIIEYIWRTESFQSYDSKGNIYKLVISEEWVDEIQKLAHLAGKIDAYEELGMEDRVNDLTSEFQSLIDSIVDSEKYEAWREDIDIEVGQEL